MSSPKVEIIQQNTYKVYNSGRDKGREFFGMTETVKGEAITLKDTSPVEHIMDIKVRGKNLIPYPYFNNAISSERNGITITVDNDGVITLNGTATGIVQFNLFRDVYNLPNGVKVGDKITFSKNLSNSADIDKFHLIFNYFDVNGAQQTGAQIGLTRTEVSYTIPNTWFGGMIYFFIPTGTVCDNVVFKPQIELGSVATGWTPYIEDISTVKLNTLGKNLIDVTTAQHGKYLYGGGVGGVMELRTHANRTVIAYVPVKPNTTYTFSLDNSLYWLDRMTEMNINNICVAHYGFYVNVANDYPEYTFTTKADTSYLMIQLKNKNEVLPTTEDLLKINLQLEQGSATEFEAYKEPVEYAVNPDGTVTDVKSMYPNITLTTDTVGAVIDCEYYQDAQKVIDNLTDMLISLGGEL